MKSITCLPGLVAELVRGLFFARNRLGILSLLAVFLCALSPLCAELSGSVLSRREGSEVLLENKLVGLRCDLARGRYRIVDRLKSQEVVGESEWRIDNLASSAVKWRHEAEFSEISDALGRGTLMTVRSRAEGWPDLLMCFAVYEGKPLVALNCGLDNRTDYVVRIQEIHPLAGLAFVGGDLKSRFFLLDGNGGGQHTAVRLEDTLECRNNLLAFFGPKGGERSLVVGGLSYHEFEKFCKATRLPDRLEVAAWSRDPVGRRVDPGVCYLPDDRFYLDAVTVDPFESLEAYGLALRAAQRIRLPVYDFPTLCLWYAGSPEYGGGPMNNNSRGAVEEMEEAVRSGFLKYSRLGIRLVPDNYDKNNQQGWWDDAHWQTLANTASTVGPCYQPPYETSAKWAGAVTALGGVPITYSQTARRSEDYCLAHPEQMLFNDSHQRYSRRPDDCEIWWYGKDLPYWGYDFTDPGFVAHLKDVYGKLGKAGVRGIMFDYPSTAWAFEGGMEDPLATTASAYRKVFSLAQEGLGAGSYIDERNVARGSDVALGAIASQRTWGDTDVLKPLMASWCGLRWYKNRVAVHYDMDAKNPNHVLPGNRDGSRAMLTMSSVVAGRFLLGLSFSRMSAEQFYDLTRLFPFPSLAKSARPLDAFSGSEYPRIYDLKINPAWHQLVFYNTAVDPVKTTTDKALNKGRPQPSPVEAVVSVSLAAPAIEGGVGLDAAKSYYVHDFWNDRFLGKRSGGDTLVQELRPGEARMMSIHEVEPNPQFLSTNRHILQGLVDMPECSWKVETSELSGLAKVVGGEAYVIVVAANGRRPLGVSAPGAKALVRLRDESSQLYEVMLESETNAELRWTLRFSE